jgi:hypothetical protein
VLAGFRPGRVVSLQLSREQKRALRDVDGRIALDVLRNLLGPREALEAPERFPLTEQAMQAFTRKLGLSAMLRLEGGGDVGAVPELETPSFPLRRRPPTSLWPLV